VVAVVDVDDVLSIVEVRVSATASAPRGRRRVKGEFEAKRHMLAGAAGVDLRLKLA
jgi:hypothetical protein